MNVRAILLCLLNAFVGVTAFGMPEFAIRENRQCGYCHVNPAGGGPRNYRGAYYASRDFSFAGFVDVGATRGAVREMWREIMPKGTRAIDSFSVDGINRLFTFAVNDGTGRLTANRWDGTRFNAEAVALTTTTDGATALLAYRVRSASVVALGRERYSLTKDGLQRLSDLGPNLQGRQDGTAVVASNRIFSSGAPIDSGTVTVDLRAAELPARFREWHQRGYDRFSTLRPDRYTPPVVYAARRDRLVALNWRADRVEQWESKPFDGEIIDLKTGDPRGEGHEVLLALIRPTDSRANPLLVALRQN